MEVMTVGIDLAKSVFQIHGVDVDGNVVLEKKVRRGAFLVTNQEVSFGPKVSLGSATFSHREYLRRFRFLRRTL